MIRPIAAKAPGQAEGQVSPQSGAADRGHVLACRYQAPALSAMQNYRWRGQLVAASFDQSAGKKKAFDLGGTGD